MPAYDTKCTHCHRVEEIIKAIHAPLPRCAQCGHELKQIYHMPQVRYNAPDFFYTDNRFEKMVGPKRYARFKAKTQAATERQRTGRLTDYEREIEKV